MKKGHLILILTLVTISFISFIVSTGVDTTKEYHNSSNISLGVDGISQTIDTVVTGSFAFPSHTYTSIAIPANPGHDASQIWVSVEDGEMNLFNALNSTDRLCPMIPPEADYVSSPADKSQPYHYAKEIQLPSGKNLQESIDEGDYCYSWYTNLSTCSAVCGGGTRTTYCTKNGVQVADAYCSGTKPSVACNTQSCVWTFAHRGCAGADCMSVFCGSSCCPTFNPAGQACSPAGRSCSSVGGLCAGSFTCAIWVYTCT